MADNSRNKYFLYQASQKRHQRSASAASGLAKPSTGATHNALPLCRPLDGQFNPPKSASSSAPREQLPTVGVRDLTEQWNNRTKADVQSPSLLDKPMRRAELSLSCEGSPTIATFHDDLLKSSPRLLQLGQTKQSIGLSYIQNLYEEEPTHVHEHTTQNVGQTKTSRAPRPAVFQVPQYMTAFEYAMRPFLNLVSTENEQGLAFSPPPSSQPSISATCSSLSLPSQDDGSLLLDSKKSDGSELGSPAATKKRSEFASLIQHIALQTALVQCTMLQNTVQQLQRRPWEVSAAQHARWHYEKICALALRALQLSRALKHWGLQARSEYWAGRGYGGMRDYQAAEAHFREAIRLQKLNQEDTRGGTSRSGGLLPAELEDVEFLLGSCCARLQDQKMRSDKFLEIAQQEAAKGKKSLQNCLNETLMVSPPWMPDRDRIMELARRQFGQDKPPSKITQLFVHQKQAQILEAEVQDQIVMEGDDLRIITTKCLSRQEYEYIIHGDRKQAEPSLPPATGLLDRRAIELSPISTQFIQAQSHIGNATYVSALAAKSSFGETKTTETRPVTSAKPLPLLMSSPPIKQIPSFGTLNNRLTPVSGNNDDAQAESYSDESDDGTAEIKDDVQPESAPIEQSRRALTKLKMPQAACAKLPQSMPNTPLRSRSDTNLTSRRKFWRTQDAIGINCPSKEGSCVEIAHSPMGSGRSFHSSHSSGIMT